MLIKCSDYYRHGNSRRCRDDRDWIAFENHYRCGHRYLGRQFPATGGPRSLAGLFASGSKGSGGNNAAVDRGGYHISDLEALRPTDGEFIQAARWAPSIPVSQSHLGIEQLQVFQTAFETMGL